MLLTNDSLSIGIKLNPINISLFTQYNSNASSLPPPITDNWVEDFTGEQMYLEDLSDFYIFVTS